jgi:hypothetical protein
VNEKVSDRADACQEGIAFVSADKRISGACGAAMNGTKQVPGRNV